jgi:hypothetical protein
MSDPVSPPGSPVYVPPRNNRQGWGVAALIIALAVIANAWAVWVHHTTYRPANDVTRSGTPRAVDR